VGRETKCTAREIQKLMHAQIILLLGFFCAGLGTTSLVNRTTSRHLLVGFVIAVWMASLTSSQVDTSVKYMTRLNYGFAAMKIRRVSVMEDYCRCTFHSALPQRLRRVNEQQSCVTKLRQIPKYFISNIVGGLVEAAESIPLTRVVESYAVERAHASHTVVALQFIDR
jgi:hypothetical protein